MIHNVTRREYARDAGLCGVAMDAGLNFDITIFQLKLAFEERRVWAMTDGYEKSGDVQQSQILSLCCVSRRRRPVTPI